MELDTLNQLVNHGSFDIAKFYIGVLHYCLKHNRDVTGAAWFFGNVAIVSSIVYQVWQLFSKKFKSVFTKKLKAFHIGMVVFFIIVLVIHNIVALGVPIDEKDAIEQIIDKHPDVAKIVSVMVNKYSNIGQGY